MKKYGCHNRKPYVQSYPALDVEWDTFGRRIEKERFIRIFGQPTCQYRLTELGKQDVKCIDCIHKEIYDV